MPLKQIITQQPVTHKKLSCAKNLRQNITPAERVIWKKLRENPLDGFHFRRQQVIEPYIVDFYCHQAALVIEIDGDVHGCQEKDDQLRDLNLQARGMTVMRFTYEMVKQNPDTVVEEIYRACRESMNQHKV